MQIPMTLTGMIMYSSMPFMVGVSNQCCRQNITIYAHETMTKYSSLNPTILNGSLQEAAEQIALVTGAAQYSHPLDIRFVYRREEIVT
jgi:hypothetical protein